MKDGLKIKELKKELRGYKEKIKSLFIEAKNKKIEIKQTSTRVKAAYRKKIKDNQTECDKALLTIYNYSSSWAKYFQGKIEEVQLHIKELTNKEQ